MRRLPKPPIMASALLDWLLFGFGAVFVTSILASIIALALLIFWLWMLTDCLKRPDKKFRYGGSYAKLIWVIVLVSLTFLGALVYYFMIKRKAKRRNIMNCQGKQASKLHPLANRLKSEGLLLTAGKLDRTYTVRNTPRQ